MTTDPTPTCWIIAGPNGAGKTTYALNFLGTVKCQHFVNADLIAGGLSPLNPETVLPTASRLFLAEIQSHIRARHTFAFETTLSGRSYLKRIRQLRADGWRVELIYLALPNVEMSRLRVEERVTHGGHNIPLEDIERRFPRSLLNLLTAFSHLTDRTQCFMNDGTVPDLVFIQEGGDRTIVNPEKFSQLERGARL